MKKKIDISTKIGMRFIKKTIKILPYDKLLGIEEIIKQHENDKDSNKEITRLKEYLNKEYKKRGINRKL